MEKQVNSVEMRYTLQQYRYSVISADADTDSMVVPTDDSLKSCFYK